MIGIVRAKRGLALTLVAVASVFALGLLKGLSMVAGHFGSGGATTVEITDEVTHDALAATVTWQDDIWHGPRPMDPRTRRELGQVYARAWLEIGLHRAGTSKGVDPTFAGPALLSVRGPVAAGSVIAHDHQVQLRFYSDDGTIVGLHSATRVTTVVPLGKGDFRQDSVDILDVVLQLGDDAAWRIHQWQRVGVIPVADSVLLPPPPSS